MWQGDIIDILYLCRESLRSRLAGSATPFPVPHSNRPVEESMSAIFKQNASISVPSSEVPIGGSYDVVGCGGGPAGLIAAVAAARNGARTLLIERYGFVGGMSTSALVTPISEF